ncbi:MAG: twin-arginine translocation signal domain-containing protein, partial [Betaproteobacteria bacterium]|nr:twin-arginine translocation signal domain-containing protein [Betaproteobacteria bacterium]
MLWAVARVTAKMQRFVPIPSLFCLVLSPYHPNSCRSRRPRAGARVCLFNQRGVNLDRRRFLKTTAAAAAVASMPWREAMGQTSGEWRGYEIATRMTILRPQGISRAWIPLPMMDETEWHRPVGSSWSGNASRAQIERDGKYGAAMMYAEWSASDAMPVIEVTSSFMTRDRAVDLSKRNAGAERLSAADIAFYTAATEFLP